MNPNDIQTLKKELEVRKADILASLAGLPSDMHQRNQHVGDSIDKSKAQVDHAEASDLRLLENSRLREVERALERIANHTYLTCEECEDVIPIGRLKVNPTATRCMDCQEDFEKFNTERKPKRTLLGN